MGKMRIAAIAAISVVVLVVGGTWVFINVIKDEPASRLTLDDSTTSIPNSGAENSSTTAPSGVGIDGEWKATADSIVGYRVKETLFGQSTEGVGRTNSVASSMTIAGTTIEKATFEVDMTTVKSDSDRRDGQFNDRIMETAKFPKATFVLTAPIKLANIPADGEEISVKATGDLTLKGTTKTLVFEMSAKRSGATISTLSNIKIVFDEWGIDNPSGGPATTGDDGDLEIKLVFQR